MARAGTGHRGARGRPVAPARSQRTTPRGRPLRPGRGQTGKAGTMTATPADDPIRWGRNWRRSPGRSSPRRPRSLARPRSACRPRRWPASLPAAPARLVPASASHRCGARPAGRAHAPLPVPPSRFTDLARGHGPEAGNLTRRMLTASLPVPACARRGHPVFPGRGSWGSAGACRYRLGINALSSARAQRAVEAGDDADAEQRGGLATWALPAGGRSRARAAG